MGGERKDNITGREKKERGRKKTDKEREKEGERARGGGGGGGESSEIRVTLRLSGTCSAYKLKEKPKVCHWVISPLSTSWGLGLDSDRVGADSAGPLRSHSSAWHASLSQRRQSRINMQQPLTPAHSLLFKVTFMMWKYLFIYVSVCLFTYFSVYLFIYLFLCLFVCLFIFSVCLFAGPLGGGDSYHCYSRWPFCFCTADIKGRGTTKAQLMKQEFVDIDPNLNICCDCLMAS